MRRLPGDPAGVSLVILVLAGTSEAREIIAGLAARGQAVVATATTAYGAALARQAGAREVLVTALTPAGLAGVLKDYRVRLVIDATHPFATGISAIARQCCRQEEVPYLRYARSTRIPGTPGQRHLVDDWPEAAARAGELGEVIFLTIGSRHLDAFKPLMEQGKKIVARVLPDADSLAACKRAGLTPADVVAMQGPFTVELNRALFRAYGAQVMVTKESGVAGGLDTKLEAAQQLGLAVVMVRRPPEEGATVSSLDALWHAVEEEIFCRQQQ